MRVSHLHLFLAAKDESHCVVCGEPGDILRQLFCTSCGQHYHGDCLDPEIECNTVVRAGWQCPECKVCQGCRNPGDDNKMLVCDFCDKGYHTFCLNPAMKGIPNNSWRCSVRFLPEFQISSVPVCDDVNFMAELSFVRGLRNEGSTEWTCAALALQLHAV